MNFTADDKKLLVVYRSMPQQVLSEDVDIIITPQFYTLKKESLPLKYGFQAKRIAASVFEGILEEDKSYEYFVYKEDEAWVFIAYCMDEILQFLESKNIDPSLVSRLFFAEQFARSFQIPYALNESEALTVIDDTVVILPRAVIEEERLSLVFDQSTRPKKSIVMQGASSLIFSRKQAVLLAAILLVLAILYMIEGSRYDGSKSSVVQEYENLIRSNPALENQYTRENILHKYEKIDKEERAKREVIKTLSLMITKGVTLESIKLDEKGFKAYLMLKDVQMRKNIEALAKSAHLKVSNADSTSGIYVEGKL